MDRNTENEGRNKVKNTLGTTGLCPVPAPFHEDTFLYISVLRHISPVVLNSKIRLMLRNTEAAILKIRLESEVAWV